MTRITLALLQCLGEILIVTRANFFQQSGGFRLSLEEVVELPLLELYLRLPKAFTDKALLSLTTRSWKAFGNPKVKGKATCHKPIMK